MSGTNGTGILPGVISALPTLNGGEIIELITGGSRPARTTTGAIADYANSLTAVKAPIYVVDYVTTWDSSTDNTTGVNAAIAAAMSATGPGVVVFPAGQGRMDGAMVISYTGTSNPVQRPLRLIGSAGSPDSYLANNGAGGTPIGGTILDMRYDGTDGTHVAKIDTRGGGVLEIDHMTLIDGGTSNCLFIQTTNTTLRLHELVIKGNAANSGVSCAQNAIQLGGITSASTALGTTAATAGFQGYGTSIVNCNFANIKIAVGFGGSANAVWLENNTVDASCGSADAQGAAYVFYGVGLGAGGNTISGGIVEVKHYPYAVALLGAVANNLNTFLSLGLYDEVMAAPTLGAFYFTATSTYNQIIGGFISAVLGAAIAAGAGANSNTWMVSNNDGNRVYGGLSSTGGLASAGATASTSYGLDTGDGTGQRILRINGGASGNNNGGAIYIAHAGTVGPAFGTYSAVRGGSFDSRFLLSSSSGVVLGYGNNNVAQTGATGLKMLAAQYFAATVDNALTATGTTRADALALGSQSNRITTAAAGTGAVLPAVSSAGVGATLFVFNDGANVATIYAAGSDTIDGVAGSTGVPLTNAKRCSYFAFAANTWISAQLGVVSA